MKKIFIPLSLFAMQLPAHAQQWPMQACIKYAQAHNLTIKDDELNTRRAELEVKQNKLSQLPSINGSASYGKSYTSVINSVTSPSSSAYTDVNYGFTSFTGNANVLLFGWFARRNSIQKSKLLQQAASAEHEQMKQDISLNVATGYLRALLAKERINMTKKQMELTATQMGQAHKQVKAGTAAELGEVLLRSQLSMDSTTYLFAVSEYNSAMLDVKALLNLTPSADFEILDPEVSMKTTDVSRVAVPEVIYEAAKQKMGRLRGMDYNVEAAEKTYNSTSALRYPNLSLVAQANTVYTNIGKTFTMNGVNNVVVPATYIEVNGTQYPVYQSTPTYDVKRSSFGDQLSNNMSRIYALSLNVPIFNGWRAQYNSRSAKIAVQSEKYKRDIAQAQLRSEVYKACEELKLAAQKYNAARNSMESAQSAIFYAQKRMSNGLMTTIEYLQVQNSSYGVREQLLAAKYDYILKLKIIDYYLNRDMTI